MSLRTKQGLAAAKANGSVLGRPLGALSTSKLDPHKDRIIELLVKGVSLAAISKVVGVSKSTLYSYAIGRGLISSNEVC